MSTLRVDIIRDDYFCVHAVLLSLGLGSGEDMVTVAESGVAIPGSLPVLTVSIEGVTLANIPIRITPQIYGHFSTSLLDELYPSRPIRAATGNSHNSCSFGINEMLCRR